jgi:hypothetical protein
MLCFCTWCENNEMTNIKLRLRNFTTVADYLHCPLEHTYCYFHAVVT